MQWYVFNQYTMPNRSITSSANIDMEKKTLQNGFENVFPLLHVGPSLK